MPQCMLYSPIVVPIQVPGPSLQLSHPLSGNYDQLWRWEGEEGKEGKGDREIVKAKNCIKVEGPYVTTASESEWSVVPFS